MVYKFIERSKGVVISAVLLMAFGTFGAFLLLVSIFLLFAKDEIPGLAALLPTNVVSMPVFWTSSFLNLFIFLSWVICGAAALHLKDWARQFLRIVMAVYIINMLINISLNIFLAEEVMSQIPVRPLLLGIFISFSFYLSIIYFFSHPNIVRQFKYKSREY